MASCELSSGFESCRYRRSHNLSIFSPTTFAATWLRQWLARNPRPAFPANPQAVNQDRMILHHLSYASNPPEIRVK